MFDVEAATHVGTVKFAVIFRVSSHRRRFFADGRVARDGAECNNARIFARLPDEDAISLADLGLVLSHNPRHLLQVLKRIVDVVERRIRLEDPVALFVGLVTSFFEPLANGSGRAR